MEKIFLSEKMQKILKKHTKKIEKELKVSISINESEAVIEGEAFQKFIAVKAIEALECGFDINVALLLSNPDNMFEKINLKDYVRSSRLKQVMGRVIGEKGKAKRVISELSECYMSISDGIIGLIGKLANVSLAARAVKSLIRGSPHSSVYSFLERSQGKLHAPEEDIFDKEEKEEE